MGRSKADNIVTIPHEAISIRENGSYDDANSKKGQDTAIPAQEVQSCVHGLAAPDLACTASVRAQELPQFVEFLQEAFGVGELLGLSRIPHYTMIQKAAARLTHGMLVRILESFVLHAGIRRMLAVIDSTGLSHGQASYYYTKRLALHRRFVKVSVYADMKRQIIYGVTVRHDFRHDSMEFVPLLERTTRQIPVSTVVADRGYDSERNHMAAEDLGIQNIIIRPKYEHVHSTGRTDCTARG